VKRAIARYWLISAGHRHRARWLHSPPDEGISAMAKNRAAVSPFRVSPIDTIWDHLRAETAGSGRQKV